MERKEITKHQRGYSNDSRVADIYIGETVCIQQDQEPLPAIKVDEPTISLNFLVNDSPFAGRDGKL